MKNPRTLKQLEADPRIIEVWKENDGFRDDGRPAWWALLADGWNSDGASTLHEGTIRELCEALRYVAVGERY